MAGFNFKKAFYQRTYSQHDIILEIDAFLGSRPAGVKVTAIPFSTLRIPRIDFVGQLGKLRKTRLLTSSQGLYLFELTYTYKEGSDKRTAKGKFYIYEHPSYPNVYTAITLEGSGFVRRGLLPLLRTQFPHVVVGFLPHSRLKRLLTDFRSQNGFSELIITRATQRLRLPEAGVHRRVIPVMSWPDMALDEAINWLAEHNGWFQAVQFDAKRDRHTVAQVAITREGLVKCDYLFENIWKSFVLPICKMHHENFNLFSRRGRRDNSDLAARPLVVRFDNEQFASVDENKTFIRAMTAFRSSSVSVLHGNPYIHLGVIDYTDGSAFDLWVLDAYELVIVPQMHGSVGSIKRLINHVFDTYAEGELVDYEVTQ